MPTKEQYLNKLNNAFGLIDEDDLNSYEKEVYNLYKGKTPEEVTNEYSNKREELISKTEHIEDYIEELKETDDTARDYANSIKFRGNNVKYLDSEIKRVEGENRDLSDKIEANKKEIEELEKKVETLQTQFDSLEPTRQRQKQEVIDEVTKKLVDEANKRVEGKKEAINKELTERTGEVGRTFNELITPLFQDINNKVYEYLPEGKRLSTLEMMDVLHKKNQFFIDKAELCQKQLDGEKENLQKMKDEYSKVKDANSKELLELNLKISEETINLYQKSLNIALEEERYFKERLEEVAPTINKINEYEEEKNEKLDVINKDINEKLKALEEEAKVTDDDINAVAAERIHKIEVKYYSDRDNIQSELENDKYDIGKLKESLDSIPKKIEENKKDIDQFTKDRNLDQEKITSTERELESYALKRVNKELTDLTSTKMKIDQYGMISKALGVDKPEVNAQNVFNGLSIVKKSYMEYYNNHNFIGRFFKFLPFTSAHQDYAKFNDIRDKFIEQSKVNKEDIDNYLDNGTIGGSLSDYQKSMSEESLNKALSSAETLDYANEQEKDFQVLLNATSTIPKNEKAYEDVRIQLDETEFVDQPQEIDTLDEIIEEDERTDELNQDERISDNRN